MINYVIYYNLLKLKGITLNCIILLFFRHEYMNLNVFYCMVL